MCNLYSITKGQAAMRDLFLIEVEHDRLGNFAPLPSVFPDGMAPVVRTRDGRRELLNMRWGFPKPPNVPAGGYVTNVRNAASPYWRGWLKPEYRCLVPFTSFCEYQDGSKPAVPKWFAADESRPLMAFAGIWRPWSGTRGTKAAPVEGEHLLYSFLTCEANSVVKPVHAKAMPVILPPESWDAWLTAPAEEALKLQVSCGADVLRIVATGSKSDKSAD